MSARRRLELLMLTLVVVAVAAGSQLHGHRAASPGPRPAEAAHCRSWVKTGPITNTATSAIIVSDRDGAIPVTRLAPGGSVRFRETLPATTVSHTDRLTVRVGGRSMVEDVTMTRPASCRP